jgi:mono/diheme cytochrome c family protein
VKARAPCRTSRIATGATILVALCAAACGTARRGEATAGPLVEDATVAHGGVVYARFCHQCHPGGESGLGPGLNDKPLPTFLMRFQVRNGLGAMPSFSDEVLPDEDLDDLMEYVCALRAHGAADAR